MDVKGGEEQYVGLQDGIIVKTQKSVQVQGQSNMTLKRNICTINSVCQNIIQLQKSGVQLTAFHCNILPAVGHVYKVNSKYHLENVNHPVNEQGVLEWEHYIPFQVY